MAQQGISRTPWLGSFVLSDLIRHNLVDLLRTLPATQQPLNINQQSPTSNLSRCQFLVVGNDVDNGGAKLYVGNEFVTTTFFGAKLVAGQQVPYYSMDANLIRIDHIWVLTDTNPTTVTLQLLTR